MNSLQQIARDTRRGLFGAAVPARAWESCMRDFQDARENLSRIALELESLDALEHDSLLQSVHNQMRLMDATASGLLATSRIANGLDFIPGFENLNAAATLGLDAFAGSAAIATLRGMAGAARAIANRAHRLLGTSAPHSFSQTQLSGFTPWGSIGGDIWEWFHAEQVQNEYIAVGKEPPSIEEIEAGAFEDIGKRVREGAQSVFSGIQTVVIAGAVIAAVVFLGKRK